MEKIFLKEIFWRRYFGEFGILVDCGGRKRNKEKGKRKRIYKREDIFLDSKVKLLKRLIPRFESRMRKTFRKIPKSSRNQVSRNDSQNLPKINNNILDF